MDNSSHPVFELLENMLVKLAPYRRPSVLRIWSFWASVSMCYFYNGAPVYPNLPLVPHSPQDVYFAIHIYSCNLVLILIIFSILFSHMQLPCGTHYLVILLLHHLFLFLSTIFTPYSLFLWAQVLYYCTFAILVLYIMHKVSWKKKKLEDGFGLSS